MLEKEQEDLAHMDAEAPVPISRSSGVTWPLLKLCHRPVFSHSSERQGQRPLKQISCFHTPPLLSYACPLLQVGGFFSACTLFNKRHAPGLDGSIAMPYTPAAMGTKSNLSILPALTCFLTHAMWWILAPSTWQTTPRRQLSVLSTLLQLSSQGCSYLKKPRFWQDWHTR